VYRNVQESEWVFTLHYIMTSPSRPKVVKCVKVSAKLRASNSKLGGEVSRVAEQNKAVVVSVLNPWDSHTNLPKQDIEVIGEDDRRSKVSLAKHDPANRVGDIDRSVGGVPNDGLVLADFPDDASSGLGDWRDKDISRFKRHWGGRNGRKRYCSEVEDRCSDGRETRELHCD